MKKLLLPFFLLTLSGCSTYDYVLEKIYFGSNIDSNTVVSDSSWNTFKNEFITPKFSEGYTVVNANGQWRDSAGNIIQEKTFLLEYIHLNDDSAEINFYKSMIFFKKSCSWNL